MLRKLCTKLKIISNIIIPKRWDSVKVQKFYEKDSPIRKNIKLFPKATYGGANIVTLLTGSKSSSIESSEFVKKIFLKVNAPIIFEEINPHLIKQKDPEKQNCDEIDELDGMDELILSFQRNRVALITDYTQLDIKTQNDRIRMSGTLRLFAAVMKFFPFPGYDSKGFDYDITLVGGNVMADYSGLEYEPIKGMIETLRICTERSISQFIHYTYDYAMTHKHRLITFVHKLDEFELSDGIFLDIATKRQQQYPNIFIEAIPVNMLALDLVVNPRRFDIICCNERYTNTIASIISGVCGGVELFPSTSYGIHHALFQPLENRLSLPLTDDNEMSPYGVLSACVQLLLHLGCCESASAIWKALIKTMMKDQIKTKKYCGTNTAADVYSKVLDYLKHFKILPQ